MKIIKFQVVSEFQKNAKKKKKRNQGIYKAMW